MDAHHDVLSRRTFLSTGGGLAVGFGLSRLPGSAFAAEGLPPLPWGPAYYPAAGLDAAAVRETGYCLYYKEGGCGHASAQALIDTLSATLASAGRADNPWALLPRGIYKYAGAGVVGWGTICGILNASMGVMDILGVHGALGNALIEYYCTTMLPTNALVGFTPPAGVPVPLANLPASVANTPLCHDSMTTWAKTAGVPVSHPSAKDRDAKLVGDIVYRAVELLNDHFLRGITPAAWTPPADYAGCYTCHTQADMVPSQVGRMDCQSCHSVPASHGSWPRGSGKGAGNGKGRQYGRR